MTIVTSRTTLGRDGLPARIEFPNGHPTCFVCGTCKRQRVLAHQAAGRAVVFIGDGESDRYAAGYADFVFAKRALVRICEGYGWPHAPFEGFAELDAWLARRDRPRIGRGTPDVTRRGHGRSSAARRSGDRGCSNPPEPFAVPGGEEAPLGADDAAAARTCASSGSSSTSARRSIDESRIWATWARAIGVSPADVRGGARAR